MKFDRSRLDTVQLVPLTPFSSDGARVLPDVLGSFTRWLYNAGVRVFLPAAGTSEFHSLSAEEVVACVAAVRSALPDDAVVVAPIGMSVSHALSIGKRAIEAGADALLVMPPVHPYLCDVGMSEYFRVLTDALPLPFLAYKKGPFPTDALLGDLAQAGRLVGVKYAVNEVDAATRFIETHRGRLGVYCGSAERFAPFFHLAGATGYTSGAGNLCPRLTLAMHRALTGGDYAKSMRLLRIIRPIEDYRARSGDSYNVSMLKTAMKLCGRDFGPPRPPQRLITPLEEAEIRTLIEPILAAEAELGG